jgi:hypothetical protein
VLAAFAANGVLVGDVLERGQPPGRDEHDVPAAAAITARRPTKRLEALAPEGDDPVASVAGDGTHATLIDETHL